jgi:hypothetical protein
MNDQTPQTAETAHTERSMLDRLNVRYSGLVKNGGWSGPKFLRAEHVPVGLRLQRHRICDYIATSMHSTPYVPGVRGAFPPVYHGHEVKVSRSDWLTELKDPGKAEAFRPHVHYWWLVAADKAIVRDDLPEGWGLLVPHGTRTLRIAVQATLNSEPEPMPHGLQGALLRASVTTEGRLTRPAPPTDREIYEAFHWGKCPTPRCRGDERYAAPGRGHIEGCTFPATGREADDE